MKEYFTLEAARKAAKKRVHNPTEEAKQQKTRKWNETKKAERLLARLERDLPAWLLLEDAGHRDAATNQPLVALLDEQVPCFNEARTSAQIWLQQAGMLHQGKHLNMASPAATGALTHNGKAQWGKTHQNGSRALKVLLQAPPFRRALGTSLQDRSSSRLQPLSTQPAEDHAHASCLASLRHYYIPRMPHTLRALMSQPPAAVRLTDPMAQPWEKQMLANFARWHHARFGWLNCAYCNSQHRRHSPAATCTMAPGTEDSLAEVGKALMRRNAKLLPDFTAAVAGQSKPVLAEIFSGSAICSAYASNKGLFYAVSLDKDMPSTMQVNVLDQRAMWHLSNLLREFVADGHLVAAIVAISCTEYSTMHATGVRHLSLANAIAVSGLSSVQRWSSLYVVENGWNSLAWVQRPIKQLLPLLEELSSPTDYCMFAFPVKKHTKLVSSNTHLQQLLQPHLRVCRCPCQPDARDTCGHSRCSWVERTGGHMLHWDQFKLHTKGEFDVRSMYPYELASILVDSLFFATECLHAVLKAWKA